MHYEIHWVCTLTGKYGKQEYKYDDYDFVNIMLNIHEKFYGTLFEHSILAIY